MNDKPEPSAPPPDGAENASSLPEELVDLATRPAPSQRADQETQGRILPKRDDFEFDDEAGGPEAPVKLPFDPGRLVDAVLRHWFLWINAGLLCGAAVCYWYLSRPHTAAGMQLIRRDAPMLFRASDAGEAFKPQLFTDQTLTTLARSPELFRRISERTGIPIGKLAPNLFAAPERDTDLVTLLYKGPQSPRIAVNLLNIFAEEIVRFTQEMQVHEGQEVVKTLGQKLASVEADLAAVEAELQRIPPEMKFTDPDRQTEAYLVQLSDLDVKYEMARIDMEVNDPIAEKLQAARDELAALLVRYTDAHPLVQDQRAQVAALERQLAASTNSTAAGLTGPLPAGSRNRLALKQLEEIKALRQNIRDKLNALSQKNLGYALIKSRRQSLEMLRTMLQSRQREAQLYSQNALGYYRIAQPAGLDRATDKVVWSKLIMFTIAAAGFGMFAAMGLILLVEVVDSRIRTVGDLERITGLPVVATLGNLGTMSAAAQEAWAFRTWIILKGKISVNRKRNQALVCGFISAEHGEGRSTWIRLLAKTAHQRGLRVLVASARPSPEPPVHPHERAGTAVDKTRNVVAFPFQAAQHLSDPKSHSIVHIPLPGWVWNLERRQQWQTALEEWMKIENLVFLVELPPASEPEAVLLAENLPQLLWLAESGKSTMNETNQHMETLRHAGCNLVGAVLNREPASFYKRHFSRWLGAIAALLAVGSQALAQNPLPGGPPDANEARTNAVKALPAPMAPSGSAPRPQWQRNLTLGPGDVLNLSYYGETNWNKYDVVVGMDGRISYLQAQNVLAAGLSVDQLRDALNTELAKYYRTPRVMVAPVLYRSKKYYMMGRVTTKGAYILDRPTSILEAVSRARGLETGLAERNVVDLTDLQRSFLLRQGVRVPIDFERLFLQGDFSQNVQLEPDDFIYFAPAMLKEVYVLGEVRAPGIAPLIDGASVVRVIAERGGFTDTAFKHHVLVIRGSLNHPQTFVVNSWAVLDARVADFKLMPRDIVFVARRPFLRAEELLDVAATSFLQSAVTSWTGDNIGPIIKSPFLPKL